MKYIYAATGIPTYSSGNGWNVPIGNGGTTTTQAPASLRLELSDSVKSRSSQCADLPSIELESEDENGKKVVLTLRPEPGATSQETMKIMMLMMAYSMDQSLFNALAYVKKHNLERHFTYA